MKKMIVAIASAAFLCASGALKDADGNAVTAETPFGDVDGETGTVGDLVRAGGAATEGYVDSTVSAATNGLAEKADAAYSAAESLADGVNSLAGTIGTHTRDTNNPHKVTAAQVGALPIIGGTLTGDLAVGGSSGGGATLNVNGGAVRGGHVIVGASTGGGGLLEVQGSDASIKKGGKEVATESYVDAKVENAVLPTDPTFSNAVLAVGLNIDTNSVAVLNEIAETFGGFPIEGTATTVGGLLAALAAAVAWLKKNKVGSFASVGSASATVENGVAKLDDYFTESNRLLTATIDARLPYPLYAVTDETGLLKDRAINTTSLASVTVPENFTDLIVRASVASSLSVTMPDAIATKYGDTFPGDGGEYLVTITKTGASEAYVRTIKLEVANA